MQSEIRRLLAATTLVAATLCSLPALPQSAEELAKAASAP